MYTHCTELHVYEIKHGVFQSLAEASSHGYGYTDRFNRVYLWNVIDTVSSLEPDQRGKFQLL